MVVGQREDIGVLFQGQGVHSVGMGDRLLEHSKAAKQVFTRAEGAVSLPLRRFIQDPQKLEDHAQLATVVTEVALFQAFAEQAGEIAESVTHIFGSSLGQYAAIIVNGLVSLEDASVLLEERQRLTKEAQRRRPGGMIAVVGMEERDLEEFIAERQEDLVISNHNFSNSHVISGNMENEEKLRIGLGDRGAKLTAKLAIPYASHSPLMSIITDEYGRAIARTPFKEMASVSLVPNETAEPTKDGSVVKLLLPRHLTDPVLLDQSFQRLQDSEVNTIIEFGPGKPVFVKQLRRYYPDLRSMYVGDFGDTKRIGEEIYAGASRS